MSESLVIKSWLKQLGVENIGSIVWSHGTNSRDRLKRALKGAQFIESDIIMNRSAGIICSHEPKDSDLKLHYLLEQASGSRVGLKLDFKLAEIVWPSLDLLRLIRTRQPIILNADILQGNGAEKPAFHPEAFLVLCQRYAWSHPGTIISPGWTTTDGHSYTKENVDQMIELCGSIENVTFPVRLSLMQQSWPQLKRLLGRKGWTLSVWSGTDPVTAEQQSWLKRMVPPARAFIDIG